MPPSPRAGTAAGTAAAPNPWLQLVPLILLFVVFWFLLIRPQMKRQKEHRQMVDKLAKGDFDHVPEQAFFLIGGLEDLAKKAETFGVTL